MKKIPSVAGCHLTTNPKSGSRGSRRISLETCHYPSGFCSEDVALLVRLDGEHPSSDHTISRIELPHVDEIKNFVINLGTVLKLFRFSDLFLISSCFLG